MAGTMQSIFENIKRGAGAYTSGTDTSNPKEARKAFDDLGDSIKKIVGTTQAGRAALTVFDGLRTTITSLASASTSGTGAVLALAGGITALLTGPLTHVQDFISSIAPYVNLANPGVMQQWLIALQDAQAVIGGILTPVVQGATIWVRSFGDHLAKLTPVIQPLANAMGQLLANTAGMGQVLEAMAPDIELVVDLLEQLADWFARGVAFWSGLVAEVINTVNEIFGLSSKRYKKDADSQGAAVRGVQVTSVEQFSRDVFQRSVQGAFGYGQGKKPDEFLPDIAKSIEDGKAIIRDIKEKIIAFYEWAKETYKEGEQKVNRADSAAKTVSPAYAVASWLFK